MLIYLNILVRGLRKGGLDQHTIIVPVTCAAARMGRRRRGYRAAADKAVLPRFFLDETDFVSFWADISLGGLAGLVPRAKLVET